MTPLDLGTTRRRRGPAARTPLRWELAREPLHVEADGLGVTQQVVGLQLVLVGRRGRSCISQKRPCAAGRLGRLGGELGVRVDVGERQVAAPRSAGRRRTAERRDEAQAGGARAEGALEVGELHQGKRRIKNRAPDVVPRRGQPGGRAPGAHEHAALRSAPSTSVAWKMPRHPSSAANRWRRSARRSLASSRSWGGGEGQVHDEERDREADARGGPPRRAPPPGTHSARGSSPRPRRARQARAGGADPDQLAPPAGREMTPRPTVEVHAPPQRRPRRSPRPRWPARRAGPPRSWSRGAGASCSRSLGDTARLDARQLGRAGERRHEATGGRPSSGPPPPPPPRAAGGTRRWPRRSGPRRWPGGPRTRASRPTAPPPPGNRPGHATPPAGPGPGSRPRTPRPPGAAAPSRRRSRRTR